MTKKFGDIIGEPRDEQPIALPSSEEREKMLRGIAKTFDVELKALRREINANTALGKVARDILGISAPPGPKGKRGRPRKDDENWQFYEFVLRRSLENSQTQAEILEDWATTHERNGQMPDQDSLRKQLYRLKMRWSHISPLTMLFRSGAPDEPESK